MPPWVWGQAPASTLVHAEGIRVPEYNDDGSLKSEMFGDSARQLPDGLLEIVNLRINFYDKGTLNGFVMTPRCIYNRDERVVFSNADVTMQQGDVLISGTGFRWYADKQNLEVMNRSCVIIKNTQLWAKRSGIDGM